MFSYRIHPSTGEKRLQISLPIDDITKAEITKGDYVQLWVYNGEWSELGEELYVLKPNLERLNCQFTEPQKDVSWISLFSGLEILSVEGKCKGEISFSNFKHLKECNIQWGPFTRNLINSDLIIDTLRIDKFSGSLGDFNSTIASNLKSLILCAGNLDDLRGIENFTKLQVLDLYDLRMLTSLCNIQNCNNLQTLFIAACNSINDLNLIGQIDNLRRLTVENKLVESLSSFLPGKNIEALYLGERTEISDLKTDIALQLPNLKELGFKPNKSYSMTREEILTKKGVEFSTTDKV